MLGAVVQAVVGALLGALTDYIKDKRRDGALREQGRAETFKERYATHVEVNKEVRALKHRLRSDPDFRRLVRDSFKPGPGNS